RVRMRTRARDLAAPVWGSADDIDPAPARRPAARAAGTGVAAHRAARQRRGGVVDGVGGAAVRAAAAAGLDVRRRALPRVRAGRALPLRGGGGAAGGRAGDPVFGMAGAGIGDGSRISAFPCVPGEAIRFTVPSPA